MRTAHDMNVLNTTELLTSGSMVNTMLMYFTTIKQTEERYFHTNFPTDFQKGKLGSLCGPP